jgi:hypothetical protein
MTCLAAPLPPAVVITCPTLLGSPSAGRARDRVPRGDGMSEEQRSRCCQKCVVGAGRNERLRPASNLRAALFALKCCTILRRWSTRHASRSCGSSPAAPDTTAQLLPTVAWSARRRPASQHPPVTRPSNTGSLPSRCAGDNVSSLNCCCTSAVARAAEACTHTHTYGVQRHISTGRAAVAAAAVFCPSRLSVAAGEHPAQPPAPLRPQRPPAAGGREHSLPQRTSLRDDPLAASPLVSLLLRFPVKVFLSESMRLASWTHGAGEGGTAVWGA